VSTSLCYDQFILLLPQPNESLCRMIARSEYINSRRGLETPSLRSLSSPHFCFFYFCIQFFGQFSYSSNTNDIFLGFVLIRLCLLPSDLVFAIISVSDFHEPIHACIHLCLAKKLIGNLTDTRIGLEWISGKLAAVYDYKLN
jgi:hypothetical protein